MSTDTALPVDGILRAAVSEVAAAFSHNHTRKDGPPPMAALSPLLAAVTKLRTSTEHLTPVHCEYVKVCLARLPRPRLRCGAVLSPADPLPFPCEGA